MAADPANSPNLQRLLDKYGGDDSLERQEQANLEKPPIEVEKEKSEGFWNELKIEAGEKAEGIVQDVAVKPAKLVGQAALGLAESAQGAANLVIAGLDKAENALADIGIGDGDLLDDNSQIKALDRLFGEPETPADIAGRFIGKYLITFGALGLLTKGNKYVRGAQALSGSFVLNAAVHDEGDDLLSNAVQNYPPLANPLSEYLAAESGSLLEEKLKAGLEGVVVDLLALVTLGAGGLALKYGPGVVKSAAKGTAQVAKAGTKKALATRMGEGFISAVESSKQSRKTINNMKKTGQKGLVKRTKDLAEQTHFDKLKAAERESRIQKVVDNAAGKSIDDIAKANPDFTKEELKRVRSRNVRSDAKANKAAETLHKDKKKFEEILNRNVGDTLNDEQLRALNIEKGEQSKRLDTLFPDDIDAATSEEKLDAVQAINDFFSVDSSASAGASEGARLLRAQRMTGGDVNSKARKFYMKLSNGEESITETLRLFKQAKEFASNPELLENMYRTKFQKAGDMLFEVWVNNILSGSVHVANFVGNSAQVAMNTVDLAIMEGLYGVGISDQAQVVGQTSAYVKGLRNSFTEALIDGRKAFGGAVPLEGPIKFPALREANLTVKNLGFDDLGTTAKLIDGVFSASRIPGKGLVASDTVFRTLNFRAQVGAISHREVMEEAFIKLVGKAKRGSDEYKAGMKKMKEFMASDSYKKQLTSKLRNPSEKIERAANKLTDASVFQRNYGDGIFAGKAWEAGENLMHKVPTGRYFAPFIRIGANLGDMSLQYTPGFNLLRSEARAALSSPGIRRDKEVAKMIQGAGIMFAASSFHEAGILKGSGPTSRKLKKAIGYDEDTFAGIPLRELGIPGAIMRTMADTLDLISKIDTGQEDAAGDLLLGSLGVLSDVLAPQVMVDNIPKMMGILKDVSAGTASTEMMAKEFAKITAGFVPYSGLARSVKSVTAPEKVYDTYAGPWDEIKKQWLRSNPIPGFSEDQLPQRNLFGEEVYYPPGVGGSIASVIYSGREKSKYQAVSDEIVRLEMDGEIIKPVGQDDPDHINISMPSKSVRKGILGAAADGGKVVTVKYTPEEYDDYVKFAAGIDMGGQTLGETLNEMVASEEYRGSNDAIKKIMIVNIISQMRKAATERMKYGERINGEFQKKTKQRIEILSKEGPTIR